MQGLVLRERERERFGKCVGFKIRCEKCGEPFLRNKKQRELWQIFLSVFQGLAHYGKALTIHALKCDNWYSFPNFTGNLSNSKTEDILHNWLFMRA